MLCTNVQQIMLLCYIYYTIYNICILYILNIYLIYTPTISNLIFKP